MYHSGHYYTENQRTGVILQAKLTVRYFLLLLFYPEALFLQKNIVIHDHQSSAPKRKQI